MSQSVLGCYTQPVSDQATSSLRGLVGTHLEAYANQWNRITTNIFVRSVVCNGYVLEFAEGNSPLLSRVLLELHLTRVRSDQALLNEAIQKLLEKGVIKPIEDDQLPCSYSRLFLIPKWDSSNRLVIDLSYQNQYREAEDFKMETGSDATK